MTDAPLFRDRIQAGEKLAALIQTELMLPEVDSTPSKIVYALPRGGLPVASPIANSLQCPLTVLVAKKISHPNNPELAIGAVTASGEVLWMQQKLFSFQASGLREQASKAAIEKARSLEAQFLPFCPQVNPKGAILILVDDGIATGMTIAVAVKALAQLAPAQIWLVAPLAPPTMLPWLQDWCDSVLREFKISYRILVLATPEPFVSVSSFYSKFPQVATFEALDYLKVKS
ncbi:phosphoribosyltransferase [Calothrix sp. NIES-4071]|nr:phosphoribosyltransferase [Calothrix sp. NIES-4071]BAZ63177.1 phosphoribosyltransferase [Calothrix sp. NIES-4105]